MKLKMIILILIFCLNFHLTYGQRCIYRYNIFGDFICDFTIHNPNGFNNFTKVSGSQIQGRTNEDVRNIFSTNGSISTNIPSIICETFPNANVIQLFSMRISRIDEYSFKNCGSLTILIIQSNFIRSINEKAFNNNLNLRQINLWGNQLTTLPENVFKNQLSMVTLTLSANNFLDLPKNIFKSLKNLSSLDLKINYIKNLRNEWFMELDKLWMLFLDRNQIKELSPNIFKGLKSLRSLNLSDNKLKVIHSVWFEDLPDLAAVILSNNQIYAIDEKFINNNELTRLDMSNNSCADVNIEDSLATRDFMRKSLYRCIKNYEQLYSSGKFIN